MYHNEIGSGLDEATEEYCRGVSITKEPERRLDVIMKQIFPDAMIKADEGYDCVRYAEKKIERNYRKALEKILPKLEKIDGNKALDYAKMLDESYAYYKGLLNEKRSKHLERDMRSKTRLESGEILNYTRPVEIMGKSGTPYKFDGRAYGVLFRNYKTMASQDDVKMLHEISRDCLEDVLMRAVILTPEAEALAEQLGVLVEYHTPECLGCE